MKKLLTICFVLLVSFSFAKIKIIESKPQPEYDDHSGLTRAMNDEEQIIYEDYLKDNYTSPSSQRDFFTVPTAEFNQMRAVLVRYPFGIPLELIVAMSEVTKVITIVANSSTETTVRNAYINAGMNLNQCNFIIATTDSYWTRDYGPWFATENSGMINVINFTYNRPRPNDNAFNAKYALWDNLLIYDLGLQHCGGNYMADGISLAASSDLVYRENGNNPTVVDNVMQELLGVETYHVVPDPNNTYIDHIDCWGKFLAPDKILIRRVPVNNAQYYQVEQISEYFASQTSTYGTPFQVFRVDTPNNQPYTNSLILNDHVFVPIMNNSYDQSALQVYEQAMPGYTIVGVPNNTSNPWLSTDALHCRVKEIIAKNFVQIIHFPLPQEITFTNQIDVKAQIIAFPDLNLNAASVMVHYRFNDEPYQMSQMVVSPENPDYYAGIITGYSYTDTIEYYISAADDYDTEATHPMVGAAAPHSIKFLPPPSIIITHEPLLTLSNNDLPYSFIAHITSDNQLDQVLFEYYINNNFEELETFTTTMIAPEQYSYTLDIDLEYIQVLHYRIRATDTTGYTAFLPENNTWFEVQVEVVGINDDSLVTQPTNLTIYPNPLAILKTNIMHLNIQGNKSEKINIALYNIKGQKILEKRYQLPKNQDSNLQWDLSNIKLANGVYLIRYSDQETQIQKKIVILM